MNFFHTLQNLILKILEQLSKNGSLPENLDLSKVTVEVPRDPTHGDLSTNAAMVLSKAAGKSPRDIAQLIVPILEESPEITAVSIAGPGFINFNLSAKFWQEQLQDILTKNSTYGSCDIGKGEAINVEFVSANPTGPMHTGHGRGAVLGDALAGLLTKVGYKVTREYYLNDAGGQINTLAHSAYLRYLQACGQTVDDMQFEGLYPGDYLIKVGQDLFKLHGDKWVGRPESEWLNPIREFSVAAMVDIIKDDLAALGVVMDVYTSEKTLTEKGRVVEAVDQLIKQNDIYEGVLEKPKGHDLDDWEPRPQKLFRATNYGDDVDRPLQKSDGTWTYFAGDIAYHYDKYQRGFKKMIDILGADHAGYVKRIQAATRAITKGDGSAEIKTSQLVNFMENGAPVRMSKRAGTFIALRDVVDRVGKDVTRFIMLTRHQDVPIDFDFSKVVEQSKDNPVFYVQYAHARAHSVLRHATGILDTHSLVNANMSLLTDDAELAMIKVLAQLPKQIEVAALCREPHRVANYLYEVAATFHSLWNKGKEHVELRFIAPENGDLTLARLALVKSVAIVIASGLELFGITPVEEMR